MVDLNNVADVSVRDAPFALAQESLVEVCFSGSGRWTKAGLDLRRSVNVRNALSMVMSEEMESSE